ncbi:MAG: cyclodeaminase/cyclohydrolase family protein [Planctomycetota bacterium]|nr:cyclodeaminase/cyclohydrolase family protein [Planctomycetota bacterium]
MSAAAQAQDSGPELARVALGDLLAQVAAKTPTPGGGAVASVVGALAAALAGMVVSFSLGKKSLAMHEVSLQEAAGQLARARDVFLRLSEEDAAAYGAMNELQRLPESDSRRNLELPGAARASIMVPLATMAACTDLLRLFQKLAGTTNQHLRSDLAIAAVLARATADASRWNVRINLPSIADPQERGGYVTEAERMASSAADLAQRVESACS